MNPFSAIAAEARKLEADVLVIFHKDIVKVSDAVRAAIEQATTDTEQALVNAAPDIRQAAENAVKMVELAVLNALVAQGL